MKNILKENQEVITKWGSKNKNYYINLGYKFTRLYDEFYVDISHLTFGSHANVMVVCDYCGKETIMEYRQYIRGHDKDLGDCCFDCCQIKRESTSYKNYGVKFPSKTNLIKDKIKQTNIERYGCSCTVHNPEIAEKVKQTCLERYGVEYSTQAKEVIEKMRNSLYKNGKVPTSKAEKEVCKLLKEIYGENNCIESYPFGRMNFDCLVILGENKIDVEYDGWYWHKDKQEEDKRRNYYVRRKGFKVLRIKANNDIPTKEQLINAIDYLVKDNHSLTEIILDI